LCEFEEIKSQGNVRKFYGWIQNDQWATRIEGCELTVSRRASKNSSS